MVKKQEDENLTVGQKGLSQGVTKRCRLSSLTNSAVVFEPKCVGRGGVAGSQPMSTAVYKSPNKFWRSNSIFNLWFVLCVEDTPNKIDNFALPRVRVE